MDEGGKLQLDRHGVAIEWKASLHAKLAKYQRRNDWGKCQHYRD